jgi:hypothetical protein
VYVPRINIYLPDALAEEVRKLGQRINTSAVCQSALEKELKRMTMLGELQEGMERLELDLGDHDVAFSGKWLVFPDADVTRAHEHSARDGSEWDAGAYWGVALTTKRNVVVLLAHCNDRFTPEMKTYSSLDDIAEDVPSNVFHAAKEALGERVVEELDI